MPDGMREQLADRDAVLVPAAKARKEARDARVEVELAFVHEHHRERRGDDDLRQAREVVDRVGPCLGRALVVREPAERAQVRERAEAPDGQHRARKRPRGDAALDDGVYGGESAGAEAAGRAFGYGSGGHRLRIAEERHGGRDSPAHQAAARHGARRGARHREPTAPPPAEAPGADTSWRPNAPSRSGRRSWGASDSCENSTTPWAPACRASVTFSTMPATSSR